MKRGINCKQNPYNVSHHTQRRYVAALAVQSQKFKFATSCPPGRRLVYLLWCPSVSQSLALQTSSLSEDQWQLLPRRKLHCPWCATCQAISSSFNNTAHLHTGHVTMCDFLSSQHPTFIPPDLWLSNSTVLSLIDCKGWHPAASTSVAAAQHWQAEEAFVGRLAQRHGPERHWRCSIDEWRKSIFERVCEQKADISNKCLSNRLTFYQAWRL